MSAKILLAEKGSDLQDTGKNKFSNIEAGSRIPRGPAGISGPQRHTKDGLMPQDVEMFSSVFLRRSHITYSL